MITRKANNKSNISWLLTCLGPLTSSLAYRVAVLAELQRKYTQMFETKYVGGNVLEYFIKNAGIGFPLCSLSLLVVSLCFVFKKYTFDN